MSSNSSLTPEQIKRIEENRKQALQKKAAAQRAQSSSSSSNPASSTSNAPSSTVTSNKFYSNNNNASGATSKEKLLSSVKPLNVSFARKTATVTPTNGPPDVKKFKTNVNGSPIVASSSSHENKVMTGICKMIAPDRFSVVAGYHQQMIDAFKTIPSRHYDYVARSWSFHINDHDLVLKTLKNLGSPVAVSEVPNKIRKVFKQLENQKSEDIDLSKLDSKLLNALMPFQLEGVKFCIAREGRALIADDMGLGKTIQALAVANYYMDDWPLLIVCPSSVRFTWLEAFKDWLPSVPIHQVVVMTSGKDFVADAKILIISYDLLSKHGPELQKMNFKMLILDESHSLKNFKTNRSKAAQPFTKAARRVILLSGTPALSRPIELFVQMNIINPNAMLSYHDFGVRYCAGIMGKWGWDFNGSSNMDELNLMLQSCFMIRRLKSEVLKQLPAKFRQVVVLPRSSVNMKMAKLKDAEKSLQRSNLNSGEKQGALLAYFNATSSAKLTGICDYVLDMVNDGKKFLCFAHHKVVLDKICEKLEAAKHRYIRIDGSTDSRARQEGCKQFQEDDKVKVAVLSITAASTGITLTATHLVLFAELFWNPGVLLQAEDRAHRIGQQDCVVVQYLVAQGTADDHLWRLLQGKLAVLNKAGLNEDDITKTASTRRLEDTAQPAITNFFQSDEPDDPAEADDDELFATMDLDALTSESVNQNSQ